MDGQALHVDQQRYPTNLSPARRPARHASSHKRFGGQSFDGAGVGPRIQLYYAKLWAQPNQVGRSGYNFMFDFLPEAAQSESQPISWKNVEQIVDFQPAFCL
jgi:hypothetical protein